MLHPHRWLLSLGTDKREKRNICTSGYYSGERLYNTNTRL